MAFSYSPYSPYSPFTPVMIGQTGVIGFVNSNIPISAMSITHPGAIHALLAPPPTVYTSSLPPYGYYGHAHAVYTTPDPRGVTKGIIDRQFPKGK